MTEKKVVIISAKALKKSFSTAFQVVKLSEQVLSGQL